MKVDKLLEQLKIEHISKGADFLVHCFNLEHADSRPSMRVDRISGMYNCFSCGHRGNLLRDYGYSPSIIDGLSLKLKQKIGHYIKMR